MKKYRIGFDLGGTKLMVAVLEPEHNHVVYQYTTPTRYEPEGIYADIATLYQYALNNIDFADHTVGIGVPGNSVRPTYLLDGTDIHKELHSRLGRVVKVDNDANCFTLAEATLGAGLGSGTVFGVTLGTGVGGGFVLNGQLYSGNSGLAAEWGHTPLKTAGRACWCGLAGCVEQYVSGRAVERQYRESAGRDLLATEIFDENDIVSLCVRQEFYENLAQGLATVINYYDPETIVIGGSLGAIPEIYEVVPAKVQPLIFNLSLKTRIVPALLGNASGAIGAALL